MSICWGVLCSFIMGFNIGSIQKDEWKREAIEHGAAYYDTVTGEFTWIKRPPVRVERVRREGVE